jgi:hypothetical protein
MNIKTLISALIAAAAVGAAALPVMAQTTPAYATQDQQLHGRVISFDGRYDVQVRDDHGSVDDVLLHQGTIINPTGITLAPGMVVSVDGYNAGSHFAANEIDTPYTFSSGTPYYLGHPWNYYGPSASLGFYFGQSGWWHRGFAAAPGIINRGPYAPHFGVPHAGVPRAGFPHGGMPHAGFPHGGIAHAGAPHGHAGGSRHH